MGLVLQETSVREQWKFLLDKNTLITSYHKSTIGNLVFHGPNPISWSAKKQSIVSHSSIEVEYCALATTIEVNFHFVGGTVLFHDIQVKFSSSKDNLSQYFYETFGHFLFLLYLVQTTFGFDFPHSFEGAC